MLQHRETQARGVDDVIRPRAHRARELDLALHAVLDCAAFVGQRVRAAGFLIALDERGLGGLHVEDAVIDAHGLELIELLEELSEALLPAHVRHEGDALIAPAHGEAELGKLRQKRGGQIVHAVVVQILQHVRRTALSRAGETGNNQKLHFCFLHNEE